MVDYYYNNPQYFRPSTLFTTDSHFDHPHQYFASPLAHPAVYNEDQPQQPPQPPSPVEYHFHYHYPPEAFRNPYSDDMQRKAVHWEDDTPRTPSPAMSTSSLASSSGPITPENLFMQGLPQVHVPYAPYQYGPYLTPQDPYAQKHQRTPPSPVTPLTTAIHPLLSVVAHAHPSTQPFVWPVYAHPNSLQPTVALSPSPSSPTPGYPIPPATLALPATSPSVPKLKIRCALLPFEIAVPASQAFGHAYVTVGDVLAELHAQLRMQVSQDEYRRLCSGGGQVQQSVNAAYMSRCASLRHGRRDEEQQGIRRSDLLMGSQLFAGLEMRTNTTAVLHVRPLPQH